MPTAGVAARLEVGPREVGIASSKDHVARVLDSLSSASAAARSRLAASWKRSYEAHGLDPAEHANGERLSEAQLAERREALGRLLDVATPRLDMLFGLVGNSGCAVLLTDASGVVLEHRLNDGDASAFRSWGLWPGADWSEAAEGTNGIGTCLAEVRAVTIHCDDHFLARNIGLSCMDAPIYGPEGELFGALDVSSARSDQTEGFTRLIAAMVGQTAREIEADLFRATYPRSRIVVAETGTAGASALLAVDSDDLVVGASRGARKAFGLAATGRIAAVPASDLLGREGGAAGLEGAERAALLRALARAQGNVSEAARALGIGRATLYRRMNRLGLSENASKLSQN